MLLPTTKVIDLSYFPLVSLVLPSSLDMGYADLLEHDTQAIFTLRTPYVSITDSTAVQSMTDARTRKRMGEWAKSHEDEFRRWQVANALIVGSSIVRAGISAIHWFAPPPVPTLVETDWGTALSFLKEHGERQGVDLSGLREFARRRSVQLAAS